MSAEAIVYTGTSLSHEDARRIWPEAEFLPLIKRGDLQLVLARAPLPKVVCIIDGEFHQSLSVSPQEILGLLDRDIAVFGASSMGALRAAELHPMGMKGVGVIFKWYRSEKIMADDEVALIFDPETFQCLSMPLVNMRYAFERAEAQGKISPPTARVLLEQARQMPYFDRTYPLLFEECERAGYNLDLPADAASLFEQFDLKKEDAIACIQAARAHLIADRTRANRT